MTTRSSKAPEYLKKTDLTSAQLNAGVLIPLQVSAPGALVAMATSITLTPSDKVIGFIFGDASVAGTLYANCSGGELGRIVARVPGSAGQGSSSPPAVTHLWLIAADAASVDVSLNEVR